MKLSFFIVITLALFLAIYWTGLVFQWHLTTIWFDKGLHFYGGLIAAAVFIYWFADRWRLTPIVISRPKAATAAPTEGGSLSGLTAIKENFLLKLTLGLGFVALAGVLWEFHEFIVDWWLGKALMQENAADTILDLFFDLLGAFNFFVFYYLWGRLKKYSFMARWFGR